MARLSYCISSRGISAFSGIYMSNLKLGIYAKHKIKDIYILFYHKKKLVLMRKQKLQANYKRQGDK